MMPRGPGRGAPTPGS